MSRVDVTGKRGPGVVRAAVQISLGCVLLGGCSSFSEKLSNFEFGSGFQSATASDPSSSPYGPGPQQASYPSGGNHYQTADGSSSRAAGYMDVSRVDLPPVQQAASGANRIKTADGYGPYGPPPMVDGYSGPRVFSPYDQPNGYPPQGYNPPPGGYPQPYPNNAPLPPYGGAQNYPAPPDPGYQQPGGYYRQGAANPAPRGYAYDAGGNAAPSKGRGMSRPSGPAVADQSLGKVVRVAPGETLLSLAKRHGVTVEAIARANGLSGASPKPGTNIFIPGPAPERYSQAHSAPRPQVAEARAPRAQASECTGDQCYTVKKGETIGSIARAHGLSEQQLLAANNLQDARSLRAGQAISVPGQQSAPRQAMASATPAKRASSRGAQAPADTDAAEEALQDSEPLKSSSGVKVTTAKPAEPACDAALANPLPRMGKSFRKPVEGLIIGQFGPQRDGTVNEGLTISVPKGTPIKAAENGVVAYVGDELPGFGNLILIRHAEEYVTAYAHADEILVKKCDVVKRGQNIGTAGATGDASQPQLHFEIRKNAKPVDPAPLLGS